MFHSGLKIARTPETSVPRPPGYEASSIPVARGYVKLRIRRVSRERKRSSVTDATHSRERMSEVLLLVVNSLSAEGSHS